MNNKIHQPFIIVSLAIFFISLSYFFIGDNQIFGLKLKAINLIADVSSTIKPAIQIYHSPQTFGNKENSILTTPTTSTTTKPSEFPEKNSSTVINEINKPLLQFFNALDSAKHGRKVRIAYFGDSMIEGDLLTQDLRAFFQRDFGGCGVGFVPITSPVSGFRKTIINNASDNWEVFNLINNDTSYIHKPGISGYSFIPPLTPLSVDSFSTKTSAWAKFTSNQKYSHLKEFRNVSLFYGKTNGTSVELTYTFDKNRQSLKLNGNKPVNQLLLNKDIAQHYLTIQIACNKPTPIYGLNFDADSGVYIDNFAFRGNSGLALTKIPYKVLKEFNQYLKYDLIVLQYGLNVANAKMHDYSWYEAGMIRVINYLKSCFPQANFLIVSVGDKSYNNNGTYETDPSIPLLVETQKQIAKKTGSAFWNLYEAMGGYNSMVQWVEGDTAYANKDYTHLNHKGAAKVAKSLYGYLMYQYQNNRQNKETLAQFKKHKHFSKTDSINQHHL